MYGNLAPGRFPFEANETPAQDVLLCSSYLLAEEKPTGGNQQQD